MGKCIQCWNFVLIFSIYILFASARRKDICRRCIKFEDCPIFENMDEQQQKMWQGQLSCNNPRSTGMPPVFGFSSVAKGDYVCCPDSNVWGIEKGNHHHRPRLSEENPDNQGNYGNLPITAIPPYQQTPINQNPNQPAPAIRPNQNPNVYPYGTQPGGIPNQNIYGSLQRGQGGQNIYGNQPITHTNPNIYDNQPPDQSIYGNQPDLGGYPQNPAVPQYPNNVDYPNQIIPSNPDQSINQNPIVANPNQQQPNPDSNSGSANSGSEEDANNNAQCSYPTSLPPDPKSGCCGRDMSDASRVTDLQSILNLYAPSTGNNWQRPAYENEQNYQSLPYYPNQRRKRSADNTTESSPEIEDRIAGGTETELDQFPWTALLKITFDYGDKKAAYECGGSLISLQYVLTAGHCVYEQGATVVDVEVTLAEYDKRTFPIDCVTIPGEGRQCIKNVRMHAEAVIRHPKYDDIQLHNDIALIRLLQYAPYTRYIRPICLPSINIDNPDLDNLPLAVAGWGRDGQYRTEIKQSTVVHLVPHDECEKSYPNLSKSHLCAAGRTGEDTCKGDSGGPLMMLYRGSYYVIGVVSGKRADSPCGSTVPSLYTNVYQYIPWIRSNIRS